MGTYQRTSKIRAKSEKKIKGEKLIIYVILELPDKLPLMYWEKSRKKEKSEKYEKYEKSEKSEKWKKWKLKYCWIRACMYK